MSHHTTPNRPLDDLFRELAGTRSRFEVMRSTNGSLEERAILVSRLHSLRAEIAAFRPPVL